MFTANHCDSSIVKPDAASLSSYVGMTKSGSHLVRIRDVAFAILGFQLFFRLIGTASLDSNWCLTNSGEGDQGSVSLHVATSVGCLSDQVLTESESVN